MYQIRPRIEFTEKNILSLSYVESLRFVTKLSKTQNYRDYHPNSQNSERKTQTNSFS